MDSKQYIFNQSKLTVKFGNILESQAEVIVSSDDCNVSMGGGVSRAILKEGGPCIKSDAQKMVPVPLLIDIYDLYSESDYITLFESLAAKAALVEYKQGLITNDEDSKPVQFVNVQLPEKDNMDHEIFQLFSKRQGYSGLCF